MPNTANVLFIHSGRTSFVKEDLEILGQFSQVLEFHFTPSDSILKLIANFTRQFFWLFKNISSANACYCWFSDYHGLLPLLFSRMFNIPFIAVLGGFDCNKFEQLNYGIFCSSWRAPIGRYILRNSSFLLPVDEHLICTDNNSMQWNEAHPNGVKNNVPGFNTSWEALPTGYDPDNWQAGPTERKKIVSTVAFVSNHRTALIKGWDLFIETGRLKPDFQFNIVGCSPSFVDQLKEKYNPPENIFFIPPQPREGLAAIYKETSVYLQLSRSEGLPNVLCEAMICGCVPIGSPVFGIPNAIGDSGYLAQKPDPEEISNLIAQAHERASEFREKAIRRISDHFSIEKRAKGLRKLFDELDVVTQK